MPIGLITGTATYSLPGHEDATAQRVTTPFGDVEVARAEIAGVEVLHLARHGRGHERLSSQVEHRANVLALKELGAQAVVGTTVCGGLDPDAPLGQLIVFDDLHFPINRLGDGSLCSLFATPGQLGRGHWIYDRPFSEPIRQVLLAGAEAAGHEVRDGGCYGHVDGPRFNTRTEVAALRALGVAAVSQTAGPETVLCGEAELPYALIGFVTDYANGIAAEPTSAEDLARLLAASRSVFADVVAASLPRVAQVAPEPTGFVYRLG
ncbi:MAG: MTAP family purine nucleoside phosphorylase [Thermoleophilia bacterium]|nr:MTAP family purine nucleoside phosphorylase [Thermoleophilia bacterium]